MESGRKFVIGGNWKSNGSLASINTLINDTLNKAEFDESRLDVVVSPIAMHIATVKGMINPKIQVACQNISATDAGAFTGEITASQAKDFDLNWCVIGHSERRSLYGETDEVVAQKVAKAQASGLNAMVCIGEMLEERENGTTNQICKGQLDAFKESVTDWSKIVIAYEPVWAIGTGKTATPQMAEDTHIYIRSWFTDNVGPEVAQNIRIQYGGSVSAKNASDLIAMPNIDGFLVGGASLKPDFLTIIDAVSKQIADS